MLARQEVERIAENLLARDLDPGPRVRLLRDVLGPLSSRDPRAADGSSTVTFHPETGQVAEKGGLEE